MAVPVQTPFVEYIANGVTTNFPLGFDCETQSHLIVTVDDIEPITGSWSLLVGAVVFNSAPITGSKIIIKRNSPFERDRDFQLYDQSFRPPAVNLDLDRIWRKLQELGVMDWILGNRIDDLKNYVDDRDDELRAYLLEEIRKQGVALDQLEDYYNYLMQRLAEIAVNGGWEASFVVDSSGQTQQQINDKIKNKTDWVVTVEQFGGLENTDNTAAFQAAYDYLHSIGGGTLKSNIRKHIISGTVKYYDNITTDLNFAEVEILAGGRFSSALYNADKTTSIAPTLPEIYYKNQFSLNANNPVSAIASDALAKSSSIVVSNATGFAVGDYIFMNNGYCDMWRVMEKYVSEGLPANRSIQDWNKQEVDLWRCEIARIKNIVGNTIYLEDQLLNDYPVTVKTYGFFSDENNRADHVGWNNARIERLGGVQNSLFKNINFNNNGASVSLLAWLSVNVHTLKCTFRGTGQGVDYVTCYNSHILNSYSDTDNFGQSIRRGSSMCIMGNATAQYNDGDAPLIIWEGSNRCIANNIGVEGSGGNLAHAKIGFYFNTAWDCVGSNFTGKNLADVVTVQFCRGNIVVSNIIGENVGSLISTFATFDVTANTGFQKGRYKDSITIYDASLFSVSESQDVDLINLKDSEKYNSAKVGGRAHIFKSFGVKLKDIEAENVIVWHSTDDDKKYDTSKFKIKTQDCVFKRGLIVQTYNDSLAQTRRSYLKDTEFMQDFDLQYTHNTEFKGVKILGKDIAKSLILTTSHFTRLIDSEIRNQTTAIDFRGSGTVGSENATSMVYMHNTFVEAPTKFLNYVDPSYLVSIDNVSPESRGVKYMSVLTDYPKIKTYANPLGDGNVAGWYMVDNTKNQVIESYTSAELGVAANPINSIYNKWLGREVFNTTVNKFMRARGSATTSIWVSEDGATTITPA